ncbi:MULTISPECIES: C40 family peptidase [Kandleria]|jgi:cell wall-associated NlpC family hydrolase|uniref:C40 family peptidase n=1 Tax=Kandleria TaxID=1279388 RepID=UPI000686CFC8|nr:MULTISPECIES: C40 family peptidase [Kandleria]MBP3275847.1 C40 family peptidase [Kandleria sp.]MEE0988293.1 C40 family peptidase [Kandleria vitulina]SDL26374.1 NlpC/P60 family protein [Kandleria vitulina]SEJ09121.1 NlpC/P60 family protein [Kandleria vitulina]
MKHLKKLSLILVVLTMFVAPYSFKRIKANAASQAIVEVAKSKIGCRYVYGSGHSMSAVMNKDQSTFDCSSFVSWVYYQSGYNIGVQTTQTLKNVGTYVSYSELKPGDIMLFPHHTGIYVGNGKMIHAPQTGESVKIVEISARRRSRFIMGRRIGA